jgi:hypothetical protein
MGMTAVDIIMFSSGLAAGAKERGCVGSEATCAGGSSTTALFAAQNAANSIRLSEPGVVL